MMVITVIKCYEDKEEELRKKKGEVERGKD
jgi:hypothetical protein